MNSFKGKKIYQQGLGVIWVVFIAWIAVFVIQTIATFKGITLAQGVLLTALSISLGANCWVLSVIKEVLNERP